MDIYADSRSEAIELAAAALVASGIYSPAGAEFYLSECDTYAPFYMECVNVEVSWPTSGS